MRALLFAPLFVGLAALSAGCYHQDGGSEGGDAPAPGDGGDDYGLGREGARAPGPAPAHAGRAGPFPAGPGLSRGDP